MKRYLNLLLVCILGWTWNMPGAEEEKVVVPENLPWAILDRAKEKVYPILKTWMEVPYTATSDGEKLKAHLAGLELNEGSASLSEEERAKLNEALLNLCLAFSTGKEEDYFAFRTPKGPKWEISSPYLTMLYKKLKEEEKEINYENLSSALIEYTLAGRKSYENFWTGVCLDAPTLEKHLGKERSIYLPKYGITIRKTEQFETFASKYTDEYIESDRSEEITEKIKENWDTRYPFFWQCWDYENPSFQESPSMRSVYKENGNLLIADIHLMVERGEEKPPCPVILSLYWNPEFKVWIPCGFSTAGLYRMQDYNLIIGVTPMELY